MANLPVCISDFTLKRTYIGWFIEVALLCNILGHCAAKGKAKNFRHMRVSTPAQSFLCVSALLGQKVTFVLKLQLILYSKIFVYIHLSNNQHQFFHMVPIPTASLAAYQRVSELIMGELRLSNILNRSFCMNS